MSLTRTDWAILGALAGLAGFIWLRDLRWLAAADDTLPILAALPLFYWLGRPWVGTKRASSRLAPRAALFAAILFPLGIVADSGLILSLGWTALLWSWLAVRFEEVPASLRRKLLVLPVLSFPWLVTDFETIAWWFRLSGAAVTEKLLLLFRVPVLREGTQLWCNHLAISVEPACSGVNGLQSMLVVGSALLYLKLRTSRLFWWNLPVLAAAAWLAHVFRITTAALCGVVLSPDAAVRWVGPIHAFTGWLGLVAGFAVCYGWFSVQARWLARPRAPRRQPTRTLLDWGYLVVLAYAAFAARGLVSSWRWAPYDRLSWLAFLTWLAPLVWPNRFAWSDGSSRRVGILWLACGLFLVAAAADINAIHHAAFAVMLAGLCRWSRGWLPWALGAVAWMPAAGWLGSRFGIEPAAFSLCRVAAATAASLIGLASSWRFGAADARRTVQAMPALLREKPSHAD
jgi:exosortase/archaeosortase family protein